MERYFFDTSGHDPNAENAILRQAIVTANQLGITNIIFYVHSFQNTGWTDRMVGPNTSNQLRNGITQDGITFSLESHRTFNEHGNDCIIVALGQNSDVLFDLECINRIRAIVALPWVQDECDDWASAFGVLELGNGAQVNQQTLPCEVEKALEQLTNAINLSTGITHTGDEDLAKTFIRALHQGGFNLDVPPIKAYLAENNWIADGMNSFTELVDRINNGGHFQGGQTTGLDELNNDWSDQCP